MLDGNFALGCVPGTDYLQIHKFQRMLERTDVITNEVLEPITFVLAYPRCIYIYIYYLGAINSSINGTPNTSISFAIVHPHSPSASGRS